MKSGYVAVIGRANAGKSTLINVLVGEKVSIVSPKPQTTRDRIIGIYNDEDSQIVFVDTPGIYGADNFLSSVMQKTAEDAANDVDLTLIVCDAHEGLSEKDLGVVKKFVKENAVVALTKTDITTENLLISAINDVGGSGAEIVPVSARKGKNLKELLKVIKAKLPEGERIFPLDVISDRSEKFMIAEIMREKILLKCDKEIPHGVAVIVNEFKLREDGKVYDINLDVICEKQNHKAIIIGKGGGRIKEISSFARTDMEKFLGKKVFLTTFVKVQEDWRNSERLVKEHGYAE